MTTDRLPAKAHVLLTALASAFLAVMVLSVTLRLYRVDLHFPLNYLGDANIFLMRAKTIVEGGWIWGNPRLGMPFGSNWLDFPLNITLDSAIMWLLSRFTSSPALIVNLEWISGIAITAALASYAFVRLRFSLPVAASTGAIFALLPYEYFRGIHHLHCLYYAVPLVALAAIELVRGSWATMDRRLFQQFRSVPAYAWIGCVVAGLAYAYTAFFALFVIAVAGALGFLRSRDLRGPVLAFALAGTIGATALLDLSPSLVYRARNGSNAAMTFKSPAETELYALKIKYLITPVPDHPWPLFRAAEARLAATDYPAAFPNENETGRLGTFGSIGFLGLLVFALGAVVSPRFREWSGAELFGPCGGLALACVLFASVGGFSDFFSAFVSPDIRCYTRIFPFVGFFSVAAAATLLRPLGRLPTALGIPVLIAITVLAGYDQAVPSRAYDHSEAVYLADDDFVRRVETVLPPNATVFQLPYTDFPNEVSPGKLVLNDSLRPYLHSSKYRWSPAAVSGTTSAEWNRLVAALPVPQMLHAISQSGFSGLWLDQAGYNPEASSSPDRPIAMELGAEPLRSPDNRFAFFDLRAYAAAQHAAEATLAAPDRLARNPVQVLFERGFYYEEHGAGRVWHWSLRRARITLVNPVDAARRVSLSMHIQTADGQPHNMSISYPGGIDRVAAGSSYGRSIDLPASRRISIDLTCDCSSVRPTGGAREIFFFVSDVAVSD